MPQLLPVSPGKLCVGPDGSWAALRAVGCILGEGAATHLKMSES